MRTITLVSLAVLAVGPSALGQPAGSAFTYQGRLTDGGTPPTGPYDLQCVLYTAAAGGSVVGSTVLLPDVAVSNGLFTVSLDFGAAAFDGNARYLEIGVRPGASTGAYTLLAGRQELKPGPQAVFAQTTPWTGIAGKPAGFADNIDNDSGGDITGVAAGTGLTGGGATGAVTLGVNFGQVAAASHDHFGASWSGSSGAALNLLNNAGLGLFVATSGGHGIHSQTSTTTGRAIEGIASSTTGANVGVFGETASASSQSHGVRGLATAGVGVAGIANGSSGTGVVAENTQTLGPTFGLFAKVSSASGTAVYAELGTTIMDPIGSAIVARGRIGSGGRAGVFSGSVDVTDILTKGGGSFKIDHPLDPENRYLYHSFVESPDMMNVYNGNVVTDGEGRAWIELPEWFEALNRDFRYQLTVLDAADAPGFAQAKVVRKIEGNRFAIRTSAPAVEVSWQVTGIRHDRFAERNRVPVEQDKPGRERGTYLHPAAWGVPAERSFGELWKQPGGVAPESSAVDAAPR